MGQDGILQRVANPLFLGAGVEDRTPLFLFVGQKPSTRRRPRQYLFVGIVPLYNRMNALRIWTIFNWRTRVTGHDAWNLANHWVAAWNAHDLELIMTHYEDAIELTSPVAAQLLGAPDGKVVGKANLRAYFQRGLEAYPELRFHLEDVLCGVNSVVLYYTNQKGTRTGEFMELTAVGKVARVVAHYTA